MARFLLKYETERPIHRLMEWQALTAGAETGESERQIRLKSALIENSVASTSALVSFLAALYRYSPDTFAPPFLAANRRRATHARISRTTRPATSVKR